MIDGFKNVSGFFTFIIYIYLDGSKMLAVSLLLSFIFILNIDAKIPRILRGRPKGGMVGVPKWHGKTEHLPSDMWLKQKLDHFNDADTMYWQQVCKLC